VAKRAWARGEVKQCETLHFRTIKVNFGWPFSFEIRANRLARLTPAHKVMLWPIIIRCIRPFIRLILYKPLGEGYFLVQTPVSLG
jgi:hypothetical protein